jgi:acyl-CoA thioester hydrolase
MDVAANPDAAPAFDLNDQASYDFFTEERLRFADVDRNGHINNVSFMVFIENARVTYITERLRRIQDAGLRFVIAHLDIDYRRQLHYPGVVRAACRLVEVRRSAFVLAHAVFDQQGLCAATGHAIGVCFDPETNKGRPIPEDVKAELSRHLPGGGAR